MADQDYNVNIRFSEEESSNSDTGGRASASSDTGTSARRTSGGGDREINDRKRMFQQMEWVFRAFRGVPGVGIMGAIGKDIAVNAKFSQQALGLNKGIGMGMIAGLAGIAITIASLLKQSKISSAFSSAFTQIIGAMIDMLLVPYIPLLAKIVEWLMKGFEWTSKYGQTIFDVVAGIADFLLGPLGTGQGINRIITAIKAFGDIQLRENLVNNIVTGIEKAMKEGLAVNNLSEIISSLNTLPSDILKELSLRGAKEQVAAIPSLKFPSMTPVDLVNFQNMWRKTLEAGGKITPRELVNLSQVGLIKVQDVFDLSGKYNIPAWRVLEVVGKLAVQAKDVVHVLYDKNIPVKTIDAITIDYSKQILVDVTQLLDVSKDTIKKYNINEFISFVGRIDVESIISTESKVILGNYIEDKDILGKILKAAGIILGGTESGIIGDMNKGVTSMGISLGNTESGIMGNIVTAFGKAGEEVISLTGTLVTKVTAVKTLFSDNIQPAASATKEFLSEAANLASRIPGYIAAAIQTQVSARVSQLTKDMPWGRTFPIMPPTGGNIKGHTGRLITESGDYNLLRGERVVREGDTSRLITVNNTITVISNSNQLLMPGILGKSLQASLMEGLENQLVRSLA